MCMNLYRNMDRTKVQFDYVKHTSEKGVFEDEIQELGGIIYEAPCSSQQILDTKSSFLVT